MPLGSDWTTVNLKCLGSIRYPLKMSTKPNILTDHRHSPGGGGGGHKHALPVNTSVMCLDVGVLVIYIHYGYYMCLDVGVLVIYILRWFIGDTQQQH